MRPLAGDRVARTPAGYAETEHGHGGGHSGSSGLRLIATWHVCTKTGRGPPGHPHHRVLLTNQNLWP
jgi:hypothetical protein